MFERKSLAVFGRRVSAIAVSVGMVLAAQLSDIRTAPAALVPALLVGVDDAIDPVVPEAPLVYAVGLSNTSTAPLADVVVRTATPEGSTFRSLTTPQGTFTAPAAGETGEIEVDVGDIESGATVTVTFTFFQPSADNTEVVFRAHVTSAAGASDVVEPTFVAPFGSRVLRWGESEVLPGGVFAPPSYALIERTGDSPVFSDPRPEIFFLELHYNLYRSETSPVDPVPENLVGSFPATQRNTGALATPGFYAVTAVVAGNETLVSNDVSLDKGEPTIESVERKGKKLVAHGTGFEPGVVVTLGGFGFRTSAKVTEDGTQVTQSGKLENGMKLKRFLLTHRDALVCFKNPNGGVSCVLFGPVFARLDGEH